MQRNTILELILNLNKIYWVKKSILINEEINIFKSRSISVEGDKSLSIRFIILSSLSNGKCYASNILKSEDVISAVNCIKKLGIKIKFKEKYCEVSGKGLFGYEFKKKLILDAGNSGTTARLLLATLIDSNQKIKITGDKSLKKRDMNRVIKPLKLFGAKFKSRNGNLPVFITGSKSLKPIKYKENLGSAQCKSAMLFAALKTSGTTKLHCLPSRNHTELMFKNVLKVPIKIKKQKKYEIIQVGGLKEFKSFNYNIPGDISSASFFIVLTLLSKNKSLTIKNVNVNPSRTGIIKILNMMGAKIKLLNKKSYKGENVADIFVKSNQKLRAINLCPKFNSSAIDEFLLIFLVASICDGMSIFNKLSELNKKESKRLDWGIKILTMMGIKTKKIKNDGIKIWGKPNLNLNKTYVIKNYLKDHRVLMTATIAGLALGGNWKIFDPYSFKTSFPSFLKILGKLGAKIKVN
jgi:3-phosphoshikimate 1-carboxyvinyltransferase